MSQFQYFFIAAGLTLVFMGAMSLVMDTDKRWAKGPVIRFGSHLIFGIIVSLVAILRPSPEHVAGLYLALSPGMVPIFLAAVTIGKPLHLYAHAHN